MCVGTIVVHEDEYQDIVEFMLEESDRVKDAYAAKTILKENDEKIKITEMKNGKSTIFFGLTEEQTDPIFLELGIDSVQIRPNTFVVRFMEWSISKNV